MAVSFGVEEDKPDEEDFETKVETFAVKFALGLVEIFNFAFVAAFRGFLISLKIGLSESEELFSLFFFLYDYDLLLFVFIRL